jgi:hypothetical protein
MAQSDLAIWSNTRLDVLDPGDIAGYRIHARDGDIGHVDKHDIDTGSGYLLVAAGPWIFGKTVMLPAGVIERIDHENQAVYVDRTKDDIKNAAEYESDGHDDTYRNQLAGYYGGAHM